MTSCFHTMGPMGKNQARRYIYKKFATWRYQLDIRQLQCLVEFIAMQNREGVKFVIYDCLVLLCLLDSAMEIAVCVQKTLLLQSIAICVSVCSLCLLVCKSVRQHITKTNCLNSTKFSMYVQSINRSIISRLL